MKEDCDLLRQFDEEGSQEAFAEIVRRHVNLVYSVAMRQVARDEHLAKDVCQEVFSSLARKAARLNGRRVISGWLYYAAKFEACRAARNEGLRRKREMEAGMEIDSDDEEPKIDWEKARPILDEVIGELKESERNAICLRFYENRHFKDVGERLDVSENTAWMRVNRTLEKLHVLLLKKGIKSSAATLAAAIGGQAGTAAPVGLAQAISASAVATTGPGLILASIGIMNTTKVLVPTIVAAAAIGTTVYVARNDEAADPEIERGIVDTVAASSAEPIAMREAQEFDPAMEDVPSVSSETDQERYARRIAELATQKEAGALSDFEQENYKEAIVVMEGLLDRFANKS